MGHSEVKTISHDLAIEEINFPFFIFAKAQTIRMS